MTRIDLFTTPHKGLRWKMGQVLTGLGAAQLSDPSGAAALDELDLFFAMLDQHTHHEDEMIAPLLQMCGPDRYLAWQREHRDLEAVEAGLRAQLRAVRDVEASAPFAPARSLSLYRAFARFSAAVLEHLDREETTLMPLLWQACSDGDLGDVMARFSKQYGAESARFHAQVAGAYTQAERVKLGL